MIPRLRGKVVRAGHFGGNPGTVATVPGGAWYMGRVARVISAGGARMGAGVYTMSSIHNVTTGAGLPSRIVTTQSHSSPTTPYASKNLYTKRVCFANSPIEKNVIFKSPFFTVANSCSYSICVMCMCSYRGLLKHLEILLKNFFLGAPNWGKNRFFSGPVDRLP